MFRVAYIFGILLSSVRGVEDFDVVRGEYEFIYHESHSDFSKRPPSRNKTLNVNPFTAEKKMDTTLLQEDLLLTVYQQKCYFLHIANSTAESRILAQNKDNIEDLVLEAIKFGYGSRSSLTALRDSFQDRLADYHCLDKDVFTLTVTAVNANHYLNGGGPTTHSVTGSHHGQHTTHSQHATTQSVLDWLFGPGR